MRETVHVLCSRCGTANRAATDRLGDGAKCGKCKAALFAGQPFALTAASFDRHLAADDLPLLVDFWAPWCGPCRMMAPAYEEAAARLEPEVRLAKLDTDAEPGVAGRYGIRGIPTLILFSQGREIARQAGALSAAAIVSWVRSRLGSAVRNA